MCRHAGFRWGRQRGGNSLVAREGSAAVWSERAVLSCGFVLCIPLFCIVVVPVPFVCCSVKLPLSQPTSFLPVYFHSTLHRGGRRSGRVALLLPVAAKTRTAAGTHSRLRSTQRRCRRAALWVVRFVFCFLLICIVVVPVPSVCCSVKLPLSQPTSFLPVSFHSPLHPDSGRGGRVALLLPAAAKP